MLLFTDVPQALLPKRCAIKLYRYKTVEPVGSRDTLAMQPLTIEGSLYDQVYDAVRLTKELIEREQGLEDQRGEAFVYPDETLHEIITNAILHRDYSIADDIHVRVFDNRIEIESPGVLAGHVTEKNILTERFARNGNVVRIINKFPNPPNKDIGEGLRTARDAMERMRLKAPDLKQRVNSVIVFIRHERLPSNEVTIMSYVETHGPITSAVAKEICHVDRNKAWTILREMQERDMLEQVPGTSRIPEFRKATGSVKFTQRRRDRQISRERRRKAIEYLDEHSELTAPVLSKKFGLKKGTAHYMIQRLTREGILERLPDARNHTAIYIRAHKDEEGDGGSAG